MGLGPISRVSASGCEPVGVWCCREQYLVVWRPDHRQRPDQPALLKSDRQLSFRRWLVSRLLTGNHHELDRERREMDRPGRRGLRQAVPSGRTGREGRSGQLLQRRPTPGQQRNVAGSAQAHLCVSAVMRMGARVWHLAVMAALLTSLICRSATADPAPGAYVGEAVCAGCHAKEAEAWRGSHHALAMQIAKDGTVLGDFNDARLTDYGVTSHFFRRDGKYFVNTDGHDGKLADFAIKYTFGVYPLQQYLIEFPDGRLQALSIAWDARPKTEDGQRWFHLYPDEPIRHDDPLHWTGLAQNWNFRCAECHSTDVHKNYDAADDRYHTTWSDIDVACEACHGPGLRHVAWARHHNADTDKGLVVIFREHDEASWTIDPATGNARRSGLQPLRTELETCGLCHSRAAELSEDWRPGHSLSDTHLVALLEPGLYYADGQIQDEVYEYGSFRQSKMFSKGVTCTDCHESHSLKLRASGDGVCLQCHMAAKYETATHNFHDKVSPPIACISCHMPSRTYMVVHVRHDHSLRIPRPDRS